MPRPNLDLYLQCGLKRSRLVPTSCLECNKKRKLKMIRATTRKGQISSRT